MIIIFSKSSQAFNAFPGCFSLPHNHNHDVSLVSIIQCLSYWRKTLVALRCLSTYKRMLAYEVCVFMGKQDNNEESKVLFLRTRPELRPESLRVARPSVNFHSFECGCFIYFSNSESFFRRCKSCIS